MSPNNERKGRNPNCYLLVGPNIPKWPQTPLVKVEPASTALTRTPAHDKFQKNASKLSAAATDNESTNEDWECLSDASGSDENGTPKIREISYANYRKRKELITLNAQKTRWQEQKEINRRIIEDEKASQTRKAETKERFSSSERSKHTMDETEDWSSWLMRKFRDY